MTGEDFVDAERMELLHHFLPSDARFIDWQTRGAQIGVVVESIEFPSLPHGSVVTLRPIDSIARTRTSAFAPR